MKDSLYQSVEFSLPASTSNCGPGFDTLSIGLSLYNFCRMERRTDGAIRLPEAPDDAVFAGMVQRASDEFFRETQLPVFGFDFTIWGDVPWERGLGSSATVMGGVILSLNHLSGSPLDPHACVRVLTRLDNAPDNVCALVRGGFCVSRIQPETGEYVDSFRFPVTSDITFVVASPETRVRTVDARAVLPEQLGFSEVVQSLNGLAYLVSAFAKEDYERLRGTTVDRIHQPFRRGLNPFVDEAIAAGVEAGAYAGWLSGSGSSVLCVAPKSAALKVRNAMENLYQVSGVPCRLYNLAVENDGARVCENE